MAYKAMRAARGVHGSRDASRMMQKMGVKMDELQDVSQVIIKTPSKDIVIGAPSVTLVTVQGQVMYQIVGGEVSETQPQADVTDGNHDVFFIHTWKAANRVLAIARKLMVGVRTCSWLLSRNRLACEHSRSRRI